MAKNSGHRSFRVSKKLTFIILVILAISALTIWIFFFRSKAPEYKSSQVKKGEITLKVLATGTVQPENRLQIKSSISGRAEKILVVEGEKVKKGQILAWISSTERAVLIDSARAQGDEEVKKWEEIYKATPIIAPLSGTIILRAIEPGQTFTSSDAIFVMADRLTIMAQVDETDLSQIRLNQRAVVTLDAYNDRQLESKVHHIGFEAKTVNNVTTYAIEVLPSEKLDFLRSGMTANVTFFGEQKKEILVISNEFIKYNAGKPTALVDNGKTDKETRSLQLGITDGKITEVIAGLNAGESVLLENGNDEKQKGSFLMPSANSRRR
jgi:macrolide-specific efflux system membrane fusion protein